MVRSFIISIFLMTATSCGKEVNVSTKKLEYNSSLSNGASVTPDADGVLIRGVPDRIQTTSGTYNVSTYSSHSALEFIAIRPLNSQHQIRYRATLKNNEIVLQVIQQK